eukprot:4763703-Pyramimonas_sp.AAC.2
MCTYRNKKLRVDDLRSGLVGRRKGSRRCRAYCFEPVERYGQGKKYHTRRLYGVRLRELMDMFDASTVKELVVACAVNRSALLTRNGVYHSHSSVLNCRIHPRKPSKREPKGSCFLDGLIGARTPRKLHDILSHCPCKL